MDVGELPARGSIGPHPAKCRESAVEPPGQFRQNHQAFFGNEAADKYQLRSCRVPAERRSQFGALVIRNGLKPCQIDAIRDETGGGLRTA